MPSRPTKLKAALHRMKNPSWVCFIWFGLTAGISLLAVPALFSADAASRPVNLDIARALFQILNKAEFVLLIALLIQLRLAGLAGRFWAYAGVLALIMIAQTAWFLPELSSRTDLILAGSEPPPSIAHAGYSVSSLLKLAILLVAGFAAGGSRHAEQRLG